MMIGYDIYDRFTVEHFPLRQSMILTTSFFARDSRYIQIKMILNDVFVVNVHRCVSHDFDETYSGGVH
jgi:hypothetical protein